jgi:hypothetical protein
MQSGARSLHPTPEGAKLTALMRLENRAPVTWAGDETTALRGEVNGRQRFLIHAEHSSGPVFLPRCLRRIHLATPS